MWSLQLFQAGGAPWVGPVAALSLLVIALVYLAIGVALLVAMRTVAEKQKALAHSLRELRDDLDPTLRSVKRIAADGEEIAHMVRHEAAGVVHTTKRLRRRLDAFADRMHRRMQDVEALYEVLYDEVEDTALDLASKVRRVRSGGSLINRVSRFLVGGRRG